MTKVGIIGTGMLGEAVGLHLLNSNHTVTVFNRTKDKTEKLVDAGATLTESPKTQHLTIQISVRFLLPSLGLWYSCRQ